MSATPLTVIRAAERLASITGAVVKEQGDKTQTACPICEGPDGHHLYLKPGDSQPIVFSCALDKSHGPEIIRRFFVAGEVSTNGRHAPGAAAQKTTYRYTNARGELLYASTVTRFPDGKKKSAFWRPGPDGTPIYNLDSVERVLYHLHRLAALPDGATVLLAEGEQDVETLEALGFAATTNAGGCGMWNAKLVEALKRFRVIVLFDADVPGVDLRERWLADLKAAGIACAAVDLCFPILPDHGKDVTDWAREGHTAVELRALVDVALTEIEGGQSEKGDAHDLETDRPGKRGYTARALQQRKIPEKVWAVPDLIPAGLTILAGGQKLGKSRLLYDWTIGVAAGGHVLGKVPVEQGEALYLCLEDNDERLQQRLYEMLGNTLAPEDAHLYPEWPSIAEGGLAELRLWLKEHPRTRLVAIDTLGAMASGGRLSKSAGVYQDDYDLGRSLLKIAREFSLPVVVAHHTNKKEDWKDWAHAVSGSIGLTGAADNTYLFERERASPQARLRGTGRDIQDPDLGLVWSDQAMIWTIEGKYEDTQQSPARFAILELIGRKGPLTVPAVAAELNKNVSTTQNLMLKLARAGRLIREDGLYRLPQPSSEERRAPV